MVPVCMVLVRTASNRRSRARRTTPRRARPAPVVALVFVIAALAVGGCGSSPSSNGASPAGASGTASASASDGASSPGASGSAVDTSLNPCNLLTPGQVAKAISMKVSGGKLQAASLSDSHDCTWSTKYGEGTFYNCAKNVTGVVLVVEGPPKALQKRYPTAQSYFASLLSVNRSTGSVQQVSAIGDAAFVVTSATQKGLTVYGIRGKVILRVFSNCGRPTVLRPELEQLLSQALART